jgi:dihydrofolate reductase
MASCEDETAMRDLVVTEFLSLDGVMENPGWSFPYWNDEIAAFKGEESTAGDALLLGRVTYQGFAAAWPTSPDEGAPYFNSVRKYVVSNTLQTADWNNSVIIRGDVVGEIRRLKQIEGGDIIVHGSGKLAQSLMAADLVDRYRLLVYPLVLGRGQRLFEGPAAPKLKLTGTQTMSTGVVALLYEPDRG